MFKIGDKVRTTEEYVKGSCYPRHKAYFEGVIIKLYDDGRADVDTLRQRLDRSQDIQNINVYWLEKIA